MATLTGTEGVSPSTVSAIEVRVDAAEGSITTLDGRVDAAEGSITTLDGRVDAAEGSITTLDGRVDALEGAGGGGNEQVNIVTEYISGGGSAQDLGVTTIAGPDITIVSAACRSISGASGAASVHLFSENSHTYGEQPLFTSTGGGNVDPSFGWTFGPLVDGVFRPVHYRNTDGLNQLCWKVVNLDGLNGGANDLVLEMRVAYTVNTLDLSDPE